MEELQKRRENVENDESLDEAERTRLLDKIDKEMQVLQQLMDSEMGALFANYQANKKTDVDEDREFISSKQAEIDELNAKLKEMESSWDEKEKLLDQDHDEDDNEATHIW